MAVSPGVKAVQVAPPPPGWQRYALLISYDGSAFRGFAENVGVRTVGGDLRSAMQRVLGVELSLAVAGRTDAGVHARGQVVSFDAPIGALQPVRLRKSLNTMLAPHVAIRSIREAAPDFHARFSAIWRRYHYRVLATEVPDPLLRSTTWWVDASVDHGRLSDAAAIIEGVHDFASFCRRPKVDHEVSLVREVTDASWHEEPHPDGRLLTLEITAAAFCHQMVRSIVGTLVEIGAGRRSLAQLSAALDPVSRSHPAAPAGGLRSLAGQLAPPHGLLLDEVGY